MQRNAILWSIIIKNLTPPPKKERKNVKTIREKQHVTYKKATIQIPKYF